MVAIIEMHHFGKSYVIEYCFEGGHYAEIFTPKITQKKRKE